MANLHKPFKKLIRKTALVKKIWRYRYRKALNNESFDKKIYLINKLDLYERKNLLKPLINRTLWVDLSDINFVYFNQENNKPLEKNHFYDNFIAGGNWDHYKKLLYPDYYEKKDHIGAIGFRTIYQLIEKQYKIEETDEYKYKISKSKKNPAELKKELNDYKNQFKIIKKQGYQSQLDLREGLKGRKIYDEIRIAIDRQGDIGFICSSGNHRLAMAKILNLDKIPVIVDGVHRRWLDFGHNILTKINRELSRLSY